MTEVIVRSVPGAMFTQEVVAGTHKLIADETQRSRLIEIATKCPVHRTLTSEVRIRTSEI